VFDRGGSCEGFGDDVEDGAMVALTCVVLEEEDAEVTLLDFAVEPPTCNTEVVLALLGGGG
jgi:hypothetical protein